MSSMDAWDYVSMCALVSLTCAVGLYSVFRSSGKQQTADFLVANRELGVFSLTMSIVATVLSGSHVLGYVIEVYSQGTVFVWMCVSAVLGGLTSTFLFLPVFYQLNRHTVYEYLELRFCSKLRIAIAALQIFYYILMSSGAVYATALILEHATQLNLWASVCLIGLTCVTYTSLGGFKAVVWADVIQQTIVFSILVLLIVKGLVDVGGVGVVMDSIRSSGRDNFFSWTPNRNQQYSIWPVTVGNWVHCTFFYGLNQSMVQRCLSNKTLTKAKICLAVGSVVFSLCLALIMLCGAIIVAFYYGCDPKIMGLISTRDQMYSLFAVQTLSFGRGLTGVFVAGLMCATISSLSSYLNSLTTITMSDYIGPFLPHLSPTTTLTMSKIITLFYGAACVGLIPVIQRLGNIMRMIYSVASLIGGPTAAIFSIGLLLPWVDTRAALLGTLASITLPWFVIIGQMLFPVQPPHLPFSASGCSNHTDVVYDPTKLSALQHIFTLAPMWYTSWSVGLGLIFALIAGKIIGFQDTSRVDPALVFPFVRRFLKPRPAVDEELHLRAK